jgi:hypothetical protein
MTYNKKSYNYFTNTSYNYPYNKPEQPLSDIMILNDFELEWFGLENPTKSIYNKLFDTNILLIFEKYIKFLENFYKEFITYLVGKIYDDEKELFYNDKHGQSYDHIRHDWYEQINQSRQKPNHEPIDLNNIMNEFIRGKHEYNAHQIGLFDFVFALNNTQSCFTLTTLKIYLASRLHIKDINLVLQIPTEFLTKQHLYHMESQRMLKCNFSHWDCSIDGKCYIPKDYTITGNFPIYNSKIEVFITIIIEIYNRYIMINKKFGNFEDSIIEQLKFILNLIIQILIDNYQRFLVIKLILKYNLKGYIDGKYNSDDFLLECIQKNHFIYGILPISKKNDKDFTLKAIRKNYLMYNLIPEEFKNEEEFLFQAIERNPTVYDILPMKFKEDAYKLESFSQQSQSQQSQSQQSQSQIIDK